MVYSSYIKDNISSSDYYTVLKENWNDHRMIEVFRMVDDAELDVGGGGGGSSNNSNNNSNQSNNSNNESELSIYFLDLTTPLIDNVVCSSSEIKQGEQLKLLIHLNENALNKLENYLLYNLYFKCKLKLFNSDKTKFYYDIQFSNNNIYDDVIDLTSLIDNIIYIDNINVSNVTSEYMLEFQCNELILSNSTNDLYYNFNDNKLYLESTNTTYSKDILFKVSKNDPGYNIIDDPINDDSTNIDNGVDFTPDINYIINDIQLNTNENNEIEISSDLVVKILFDKVLMLQALKNKTNYQIKFYFEAEILNYDKSKVISQFPLFKNTIDINDDTLYIENTMPHPKNVGKYFIRIYINKVECINTTDNSVTLLDMIKNQTLFTDLLKTRYYTDINFSVVDSSIIIDDDTIIQYVPKVFKKIYINKKSVLPNDEYNIIFIFNEPELYKFLNGDNNHDIILKYDIEILNYDKTNIIKEYNNISSTIDVSDINDDYEFIYKLVSLSTHGQYYVRIIFNEIIFWKKNSELRIHYNIYENVNKCYTDLSLEISNEEIKNDEENNDTDIETYVPDIINKIGLSGDIIECASKFSINLYLSESKIYEITGGNKNYDIIINSYIEILNYDKSNIINVFDNLSESINLEDNNYEISYDVIAPNNQGKYYIKLYITSILFDNRNSDEIYQIDLKTYDKKWLYETSLYRKTYYTYIEFQTYEGTVINISGMPTGSISGTITGSNPENITGTNPENTTGSTTGSSGWNLTGPYETNITIYERDTDYEDINNSIKYFQNIVDSYIGEYTNCEEKLYNQTNILNELYNNVIPYSKFPDILKYIDDNSFNIISDIIEESARYKLNDEFINKYYNISYNSYDPYIISDTLIEFLNNDYNYSSLYNLYDLS